MTLLTIVQSDNEWMIKISEYVTLHLSPLTITHYTTLLIQQIQLEIYQRLHMSFFSSLLLVDILLYMSSKAGKNTVIYVLKKFNISHM